MIRYVLPVLLMATPALADDAAGLALWDKIDAVFSHPRCANCHVDASNLPMWSGPEYGTPRPHGMNVSAGPSRNGDDTIACTTCHTHYNSPVEHGPPGANVWALPPVSMQWFDKRSSEICAQIKDPERNGNRKIAPEPGWPTQQTIVWHIKNDQLVHWGWQPGPGREPAPYSADQLADFLQQWHDAGAPCPK